MRFTVSLYRNKIQGRCFRLKSFSAGNGCLGAKPLPKCPCSIDKPCCTGIYVRGTKRGRGAVYVRVGTDDSFLNIFHKIVYSYLSYFLLNIFTAIHIYSLLITLLNCNEFYRIQNNKSKAHKILFLSFSFLLHNLIIDPRMTCKDINTLIITFFIKMQ